MSRLSDLIKATDDIEHEDVPIGPWGVTLRLKSMDLASRGGYLERMIKAREEENDMALAQLQAEIVVACAYDPEDDTKAFTVTDIDMLLTKHGGVVGLLANKASRLSGLDADAEERLGKGSWASTAEAQTDTSTAPAPSVVSTSTSL